MKKQNIFTLHHIGYTYDREPALSDITFSVEKGEKIALLGANGSGKSTLLQILAGLLFATHGEITAFGSPLTTRYFADQNREYAFRRNVGYVFQDSDVQLFNQTVWDEVMFGPLHMGMSEKEAVVRSEEAIEVLSIHQLVNRSPYTLSGGEKKKVALASVLAIKPDVWLLDEPTASLDPRSQSRLIDFLGERHSEGCTIITTTHDVVLLEEMAERVIIISEDHRIVADDSPKKILRNATLLAKNNLIHEHMHKHAKMQKAHRHGHIHHSTPHDT